MYDSPGETEDAFYHAFGTGNLEAMMRVWSESPQVVCIHPDGPRLEGAKNVRKGWELILENPMSRSFQICSRRVVGSGDYRIHLVEENITIVGTSLISPPILATNVYQHQNDRWYMVLHHASASPVAPSNQDERRPKFPLSPFPLH